MRLWQLQIVMLAAVALVWAGLVNFPRAPTALKQTCSAAGSQLDQAICDEMAQAVIAAELGLGN